MDDMIGLLLLAVLVAGCAPAFLAERPGPNGWQLIMRPIRRILLSIDRIEEATRRRRDVYETVSRLTIDLSSRTGGRDS
ncbi:hypothetical protein [Microlunatus sp. Gsoil 973]|jgi:hypothetical protein|uniref:hypothetical protein n=1 Tax=Microlunatus sp. Gsoil 973 TaxID=2672569 RepID=UPI0012B4D59B|nr:hypothetical protein [Microlunatus sp. Gsoil 973]QGN33484.1 hypothetical protein GJV80_12420 [Microlunatus sp. Gsoil 973]